MANPPDNRQTKSTGPTKHIFSVDFKNYIKGIIDLDNGVNEDKTIFDISSKISLEGANAWMLMCSIVIASIGLSQNSQAVIIGAMLISPLMSPILGIGLSVGINDMETLRRSLIHFGIAIFIALVTSTIYFLLTPFDGITDEILARTKPTFLDVLIAIFGGIAGIISTARKDISTTLPGVAIATALMPPLCVTGYGIASGDWEFASKSFYLFFLNTFFVALATYIIVRLLGFKRAKYINRKREVRGQIMVFLFSLAIMIPSFLIFRGVYRDFRTNISLTQFADACLGDDKIYLDGYTRYTNSEGSTTLFLKVYGDVIKSSNHEKYESCLQELGLQDWTVNVISSSEVNIDDVELLEKNMEEIGKMVAATKNYQTINEDLNLQYSISTIDTSLFNDVKSEIAVLYPDMKELSLMKAQVTDFDNTDHNVPMAIITWDKISAKEKADRQDKIAGFLKKRLKVNNLRVISLAKD